MMLQLTLLLLLALTSVNSWSFIKILKHRNEPCLNLDLEDSAPELKVSVYRHLLPPELNQRDHAQDHQFHQSILSAFDNNGKLKWQTWEGYLPNEAVKIDNTYKGRTDYVCKRGCDAGFYSPTLDSFCHYPYADKEHLTSSFEILVNEDNFEILEWKQGSYGSVPQHAVRTCSSDQLYVGKNKYGLGKVHPRYENFYLPWGGWEYAYQSYYEVLTKNRDVENEQISNVKYNNNATITKDPPETMRVSSIENNDCNSVSHSVTLSKTVREEKRWDISTSITAGASMTFSGGIPSIVSGEIAVSTEVSVQFSKGNTVTEESSYSITVQVLIPPNHNCKVRMVGIKYMAKISFSGLLTRTYRNMETKTTSISGVYEGEQIGEIHAVVERCQPIANARPCLKQHSEIVDIEYVGL